MDTVRLGVGIYVDIATGYRVKQLPMPRRKPPRF